MKTRGHPRMYKTPKEMQQRIDAYFDDCAGKVLEHVNPETGEREPVIDKNGNTIVIGAHPPTVTGLALALGFASRQALLNYQHRPEYERVVTIAKSRVEEYAESRLFDKDGANGAKFSLTNNFEGWKEKQDVNVGGQEDNASQVNIKVID